jgi:cytochrome c peroxidase
VLGTERRTTHWPLVAAGGVIVALAGLVLATRPAVGRQDGPPTPVAVPLPSAAPPRAEEAPVAAKDPLVELGRSIFFDTNLSEPRGTSCGSCHDPDRAFSGSNGSTAGVPRGSRPGHLARRSSPSVMYLKYTPKFHFAKDDDDDLQDAPHGGLFWDGRVDSVRELVRQPLLNPDEMNNRDLSSIAHKVESASYAEAFRAQFGSALDRPETTVDALGRAVEAFLTSEELAPFSSRFDAYVTGRGKLTPYEMQGMRLFKDPGKGGCSGCHRLNETAKSPSSSMFTDYGYDAVGVPRNDQLPSGRSPDLGLCERKNAATPSSQPIYCAAFRTPSLRNVAVRTSYMHNGSFSNLRDVVAFYATRATDPKRWYKSGVKFEDVPAKFRGQINVSSIPYNRHEGDVPALSDQEIDAIVAFLHTLTDARYENRSK